MKKKFIEFLRSHNLLTEYCCNLSLKGEFKTMSEICRKVEPKRWLSASFPWSISTEGPRIWVNLDNLWRKELE